MKALNASMIFDIISYLIVHVQLFTSSNFCSQKHRPKLSFSCLIDAEEAAAQEKSHEASYIRDHVVPVVYSVLLQGLVPTRWVCKDEIDFPWPIWYLGALLEVRHWTHRVPALFASGETAGSLAGRIIIIYFILII